MCVSAREFVVGVANSMAIIVWNFHDHIAKYWLYM